jgi:hypothetical protein
MLLKQKSDKEAYNLSEFINNVRVNEVAHNEEMGAGLDF